MAKPEKIDAVARMKDLFQGSRSFFVTDYQGLDVAAMTKLRSDLRAAGVHYLVAKNTLLKRAAAEAGVEGIDQHLSGPTAIAFVEEDAPSAAKVIHNSFKERELPRTKVFVVAETVYSADDLKAFAELPSREELLAQVAAAVEAPLAELVRTLDGFFQELILTLKGLEEQKQAEG
jgi:large subunit ribosomal protein L10